MTVTIIIYLSYFVTQKLYLEKLYYERKRWLYEKQTWCNMIQWIQNKNGNYFCELPKGDYIGRDLVTVDELERLWTTHRTLDTRVVLSLLTAMGTGKTQFIINNIVQLALKQNLRVLVLSPRQSLREQLTGDYLRSVGLSKPSMKFMCYQSLREQLYTIDGQRELENYYDIVIFDEVHLLFSDREFIEYNNSIYEWLLHTRQFTVSLSATYEVAKTILVDRIENAMKYTITQEIDFQGLPFVFGSEYDAIDYLENAEEDIRMSGATTNQQKNEIYKKFEIPENFKNANGNYDMNLVPMQRFARITGVIDADALVDRNALDKTVIKVDNDNTKEIIKSTFIQKDKNYEFDSAWIGEGTEYYKGAVYMPVIDSLTMGTISSGNYVTAREAYNISEAQNKAKKLNSFNKAQSLSGLQQ